MLPRVWIASLNKGWSYDFTARALKQHLSDRFDIRIAYEQTKIDSWKAQLYVELWWGGRFNQRFGRRAVKQVSSHRWLQRQFQLLSVRRMAEHHLYGAGAVAVPSLRLRSLLLSEPMKDLPPVSVCYKGFHPETMGDHGGRRGPLTVGWAGNADQTDKNVPMIIKAWPKLRVADRCLVQSEMGDFYNSLDVITCMSNAEGDPRPLIEGMACGCFPVMVNVGIVPELVRHGENGLIIPKTTEALAEALAWCRDNVDFVRAAGRRNAQEMRSTRTWAAAAGSWGDAFDAALGKT